MKTELNLEQIIQEYQDQKINYEKQLHLLEKSFMNMAEREILCKELRDKIEQYQSLLPLYHDLKQMKQGIASSETKHKVCMVQKYLGLLTWFSGLFQTEYFAVSKEMLEQTNQLFSKFRMNLKQRHNWFVRTKLYRELDTEEYRMELADYYKLFQEREVEETQKEVYCQQYKALQKECQGRSFFYKQFHRAQYAVQEKKRQEVFRLLERRKGSIAILDQQLAMFHGTLAVQEELENLQSFYRGTFEQEYLYLQKEYQQIKQQLAENKLMKPVNQLARFRSYFVIEACCEFQKFYSNMAFLQQQKPKFYRQLKIMDATDRYFLQTIYGTLCSNKKTEIGHRCKSKVYENKGKNLETSWKSL